MAPATEKPRSEHRPARRVWFSGYRTYIPGEVGMAPLKSILCDMAIITSKEYQSIRLGAKERRNVQVVDILLPFKQVLAPYIRNTLITIPVKFLNGSFIR